MPDLSWRIAMLASDLPPSAKVILSRLAIYQGRKDNAWPKVETLANACHLSPRYTQQLLAIARDSGWVAISYSPNKSSTYALVLPARLKTSTQKHERGDEFITPTLMDSSPLLATYPSLDERVIEIERGDVHTLGGTVHTRPEAPVCALPPSLSFSSSSQDSRQDPQCNSEGNLAGSYQEERGGQHRASLSLSEEAALWTLAARYLPEEKAAYLLSQARLLVNGHPPFANKREEITNLLALSAEAQLTPWSDALSASLLTRGVNLSPREAVKHIRMARSGDHRIPYRLLDPPSLVAEAIAAHLAQGSGWLEGEGPARYRQTRGRTAPNLPGGDRRPEDASWPTPGGTLQSGGCPRSSSGGEGDPSTGSGLPSPSGEVSLRLLAGGQGKKRRRG